MVPHMCDYEGIALYMDCDMILTVDIKELFDQIEDESVMLVKHNYIPKDKTKYLGAVQYTYPRKNWSSVILFNNEKCKKLTPQYVNRATGAQLHRFDWLKDEEIGEFSSTWNHLVGEMPRKDDAKLIHWTLGTPCFDGYRDQEHAEKWYDMLEEVNNVNQ